MNLKHLVFLLLLFVCVNLSAQTKEKQITISFSNIPLSEAMASIEKQADIPSSMMQNRLTSSRRSV